MLCETKIQFVSDSTIWPVLVTQQRCREQGTKATMANFQEANKANVGVASNETPPLLTTIWAIEHESEQSPGATVEVEFESLW